MKLFNLLSQCTSIHIVAGTTSHWSAFSEIDQLTTKFCVLEYSKQIEEVLNQKELWEVTWRRVHPLAATWITLDFQYRNVVFIEVSGRNYTIRNVTMEFMNLNNSLNFLFLRKKFLVNKLFNVDVRSKNFEDIFETNSSFNWEDCLVLEEIIYIGHNFIIP